MLTRLLGLETEYVLRFTPKRRQKHPGNRVLYEAVIAAVRQRVSTVKPSFIDPDETEFLANGGAVSFESRTYDSGRRGLVEGATPEHVSPSTVLLYQHAMDRLLSDAAFVAERQLGRDGVRGELRLIKNCRDGQGEVYGVQENLEVAMASGLLLGLWRVGWAVLLPLVAVWAAVSIVLVFSLVPAVLLIAGFTWLLTGGAVSRCWEWFKEGLGIRLANGLELVLSLFPGQLVVWLLWVCAFRPLRRDAIGFLVSRCLITGAGTLQRDGEFLLSEKGPAVTGVCRSTILPGDRAIFDTGNLFSSAFSVFTFKLAPMFRLFRRRQRMQLGLADANLCHVAEYLKIGLTALVVDAAEAGALRGLPRPRSPVAALHTWMRDPMESVPTRVGWRGVGPKIDAFAMQRQVLARVEEWVKEHSAPAKEAGELLRLWHEVLGLLENELGALVGQLDWVTKYWLLGRTGHSKPWAMRKKIDLRYHELDSGYLARLSGAGLCSRLTTDDEVARAVVEPPEAGPARVRASFVRDLSRCNRRVTMSWEDVKIGRGPAAKIYRFDDFR